MDNKTYHLYTDEEKLKIIKDHEENNLSIRACATKYSLRHIMKPLIHFSVFSVINGIKLIGQNTPFIVSPLPKDCCLDTNKMIPTSVVYPILVKTKLSHIPLLNYIYIIIYLTDKNKKSESYFNKKDPFLFVLDKGYIS